MKTVVIIDGNYLAYRSFYCTYYWFNNRNYNAVWQFKRTLQKIKREYSSKIIVVFDSGKSFRKELQKSYKINRQEIPDDLKLQIPIIKNELRKNKIKVFEEEKLEGDDLIGIISNKLEKHFDKIYIVSADKDIKQLLSDKICILIPGKSKWKKYTKDDCIKEYGIDPKQIPDFLALVGDKADNIEGITGIGPKTAAKLLQKYHSIKNIVELKEFSQYKEKLLLNLKLATILKKK